jgi:hypothetical protein
MNVTSNDNSCTLTESPKSNAKMQPKSADFGDYGYAAASGVLAR